MAGYFATPPVKKPTTSEKPRRGKIKAQIFGGIAEAVASATSRALDFVGLIFSPAAPPPPPPTIVVVSDDED